MRLISECLYCGRDLRTHRPDTGPVRWRKSSHSAGNGACIEIAASREQAGWVESSLSRANGNCCEASAWREDDSVMVGVRDSRLAESPVLTFRSEEWRRFAARIKAGG